MCSSDLLYEANREAFGASMNDLRAGAVLRIPDAAELAALPPTLVAREVERAVADWRQRAGAPTRVAEPGGRLRLVAPTEVTVGTGGDAAVRKGGANAKSAEPATSASRTDARNGAPGAKDKGPASPETVEQRLSRIERELVEKQRLLEVTSSQLAELQARAAAAPAAAESGLVASLRSLLGQAWWLWEIGRAHV